MRGSSVSPHPNEAEYTQLQNFLFLAIAAECGRLGMAVHLHTAAGSGSYFDIGGADPIRLESVFNLPRLRKTTFVMLHGGFSADGERHGASAKAERVSGPVAGGARVLPTHARRNAAGTAGALSGQGAVWHGRLPVYPISGLGRVHVDCRSHDPHRSGHRAKRACCAMARSTCHKPRSWHTWCCMTMPRHSTQPPMCDGRA